MQQKTDLKILTVQRAKVKIKIEKEKERSKSTSKEQIKQSNSSDNKRQAQCMGASHTDNRKKNTEVAEEEEQK